MSKHEYCIRVAQVGLEDIKDFLIIFLTHLASCVCRFHVCKKEIMSVLNVCKTFPPSDGSFPKIYWVTIIFVLIGLGFINRVKLI